ncbi:DUF2809 domain-containing protein [Cellulomonas fimi]|uniref:Uncharacterized protein n=1 Tax=Cellulomonas fimi (strain ATCC 484 / DSM 20113 / JCM 1341 / CCUG 24087 / LMG 16345 / NBRC 15513 / NCIMB 8980 / NCTC 7547 / NRS-133) TaxID=590998 RepID=F4H4L4_CELFA|nr:DUF2809 domain-containing protein [Cellulomonas fimi]AEE47809.1 hypothetical protein Celf_3703 [Cellulomonas fimi ATCC 484]NNH06053.1 DUF2809 domain-containing protein [Cellulomonas fimi]
MPARRRPVVALVALVVVAAGLAVATLADGPLADPAGDALYAVLVYALLVLVAPRTRPARAALVAAAVCALVEVAQLTGGPAALVAAVPPARFVVGTTFVAADLVAYAVGASVAGLADAAVLRRRSASSRGGSARAGREAAVPPGDVAGVSAVHSPYGMEP